MNQEIKMDYLAVKDASMIIRSIKNKLRQEILNMLEENRRMKVTDIYVKLNIEQSITSQHLAILRRAKIVNTERQGREIYYSLNFKQIQKVELFINKLLFE